MNKYKSKIKKESRSNSNEKVQKEINVSQYTLTEQSIESSTRMNFENEFQQESKNTPFYKKL